MTVTDLLGAELARFAEALAPHGVPVIIGGGYGLLLRQQRAEASAEPTLMPVPLARSTTDLDVFLSVEVVADAEAMGAIGRVLGEMGYTVVEGAKHYQFAREVVYRGRTVPLKVDLLAPPPRPGTELRKQVKVDARRVRPRTRADGAPVVQAHTTEEAFTVAEHTLALALGASGATVRVPHPFSFLLLKLFAYRDRREDEGKDFGRYHAYDLYRIVAMMAEAYLETAGALRDRYAGDEIVVDACRIVADLFSEPDASGALAVLEHARTVRVELASGDLNTFTGVLSELFPP